MSTKKEGIQCPECKSTDNIIIKAETICAKCGLILTGTNPYVAGKKIIYPCGLDLFIEY